MKKTNALRLLDQLKIDYQLLEYHYDAEDLSVENIAKSNGLEIKQIYKTLVAKGDKNGLCVAVVPGDKQLNYKALANISQNKKITLVPVKEIQGLTGYIRGGCSPIGMKKDYPVYLDDLIHDLTIVYVNAGKKGLLFGVKPADLILATKAITASITN